MKKIFYLLILIIVFSCDKNSKSEESTSINSTTNEDEEKKVEEPYPDGIYCADITYFNPETNSRSNYTLNVEVENNELIKLYWINGGWLDDSHFNPEELDENGYCEIRSDKGYEYEIQIKGSRCSDSNISENIKNLTLIQCTQNFSMSEVELSEIESNLRINRFDKISEQRCNELHDYISKYRGIKRKLDLYENGSVKSVHVVNRFDRIYCQNIIVKRKDLYFWLEVNDSRKCPIGVLVFEPTISEWQDVKVYESLNNEIEQIFSMRIMGSSISKFELDEKMSGNCKF